MVKRNSVFAIHFPYLDEISNVPDITNIHKRRELKKATSPIALFVSVKSSKNKPYELKPVAIQINNHEGKMCHECYLIMHAQSHYFTTLDYSRRKCSSSADPLIITRSSQSSAY
jgi:hypothetical protein